MVPDGCQQVAKTVLRNVEVVKAMRSLRNTAAGSDASVGWPAGHFYSPISSLAEVQRNEKRIFNAPPSLGGVDLNEEGQCRFVKSLAPHFPAIALLEKKDPTARFYYDNPNFGHGEGLIYSTTARASAETGHRDWLWIFHASAVGYARPNAVRRHAMHVYRTIPGIDALADFCCGSRKARHSRQYRARFRDGVLLEVGKRRRSFYRFDARQQGRERCELLVFEILPNLASRVYIHFHDIFYPFEYPRKWVFEGRNWNEAYIVRAFPEFNSSFAIQCFNSYLGQRHPELFQGTAPLFLANPGSSLWLRRT